jgi:hypothetical protein
MLIRVAAARVDLCHALSRGHKSVVNASLPPRRIYPCPIAVAAGNSRYADSPFDSPGSAGKRTV